MLSRFKASQYELLHEVQSKDKFTFSATSRDLLLQTFSYWSKWLLELEDHFIQLNGSVVDNSTVEFTNISLFDTTLDLIKFAKDNESNVYDPHIIDTWELVFPKEVSLYIKNFGQKVCGLPIIDAYSFAVNSATLFLNHHLFVLQEMDSLNSDKVVDFIALDRFDLNLYLDHGENLAELRLKIYKDYYPQLSEIQLYKYLDSNEIKSSPLLQHTYVEMVKDLRSLLTLTCVK